MAGCRWCHGRVDPPRRTFCSAECVAEYRVRTSRTYMREVLWERDRGVCCECGLDTKDLNAVRQRSVDLNIPIPKHRKTFFDAHHIIGVEEDGLRYGAEVLETLCIFCHTMETLNRQEANTYEWWEQHEES